MLHGVSKSITLGRHKQKFIRSQNTMASEQVIAKEAIAKAVAEVTRAAIQTMAAAVVARPQSVAGPKIGRPAMKQPRFNWEADDKYSKIHYFRLEVNNILVTYNTTQAEQLAIVKN